MTSVSTHNKPIDILTLLGFNNANYNTQKDSCLKYKKEKPNFTPIIYSLSTDSVLFGSHQRVIIYGDKFLPNGVTTVEFGNSSLSIIYLNYNTISFVVPVVNPGIYNVVVKNNITLKATTVTGVSNGIISLSNSLPFRII
jgi:hypothetical protein